mmetsp:Transcript_38154/g.102280  ORF Transcript_38154/g.102280 Transcript_38154/m.102280 type:complete len:348 (+) Transcript_38154:1600-2643(+)
MQRQRPRGLHVEVCVAGEVRVDEVPRSVLLPRRAPAAARAAQVVGGEVAVVVVVGGVVAGVGELREEGAGLPESRSRLVLLVSAAGARSHRLCSGLLRLFLGPLRCGVGRLSLGPGRLGLGLGLGLRGRLPPGLGRLGLGPLLRGLGRLSLGLGGLPLGLGLLGLGLRCRCPPGFRLDLSLELRLLRLETRFPRLQLLLPPGFRLCRLLRSPLGFRRRTRLRLGMRLGCDLRLRQLVLLPLPGFRPHFLLRLPLGLRLRCPLSFRLHFHLRFRQPLGSRLGLLHGLALPFGMILISCVWFHCGALGPLVGGGDIDRGRSRLEHGLNGAKPEVAPHVQPVPDGPAPVG